MHKGVAVIIQNKKGEYLLHLRDEHASLMPNQWSVIGGSIEPGETPEHAAIREVKEESELTLIDCAYLTTIPLTENEMSYIFHGYVDDVHEPIVLHEGKKLQFFSKEAVRELANSLTSPNPLIRQILKHMESSTS